MMKIKYLLRTILFMLSIYELWRQVGKEWDRKKLMLFNAYNMVRKLFPVPKHVAIPCPLWS